MSSNSSFIVRDKRRRGFFMVYNDIYDRYGSVLKPHGIAVYVALCRYANRQGECFPSYQTIANGTGMSRRQVMREMVKIEDLGLVEVERRDKKVNIYTLVDSDRQSPDHSDRQSPASDRESPKQEETNKYIPEEYKDIILH